MLVSSWLAIGAIVLIAPVDRIGFDLVIIGIAVWPLSMWLAFVHGLALGPALSAGVGSDSSHSQLEP